jgi:hypothetical protein
MGHRLPFPRRSRHLDGVEDAPHDLLARDLLGLGLVRDDDAVAQDVGADGSAATAATSDRKSVV